MLTNPHSACSFITHTQVSSSDRLNDQSEQGFTLIELIVFIVVISLALTGLFSVFNQSMLNSIDPIIRVRALELAQSKLDEVLVRKFAENTPAGGVPACGSFDFRPPPLFVQAPCTAIQGVVADPARDDVGDYNGENTADGGYAIAVVVSEQGTELGLASDGLARRVTVTVTMPDAETLTLSGYKVNF